MLTTTPSTVAATGYSMTAMGASAGYVATPGMSIPGTRGERLSGKSVNASLDNVCRPNEAPHGIYATGIIVKTYRQVRITNKLLNLNIIVKIKILFTSHYITV